MSQEHQFEGSLRWQAGPAEGPEPDPEMIFAGRPPLTFAPAPAFGGDPALLNPEELFLAALSSCQFLSTLALARRAGLEILSYEDSARATLGMADRRMRMTLAVLAPVLRVAAGTDLDRAREIVEKAHRRCFIANSVSCTVRIEPTIEVIPGPAATDG